MRVIRQSRSALVASMSDPLIAAVTPVTDTTKIFSSTGMKAGSWQEEAWRFTKIVPELGYFVRWKSNACAQVRLIASAIDPDTGLPTGSIDPDDAQGQRVVELVNQVAGGPLGQKRLVKRVAACLTVPGELYVCILQRPEGERWFVAAKKEMRQSQTYIDLPAGGRGPTIDIKLPDGTWHPYDPNRTPLPDAMFRVWNEAFDDATEADSTVRACLPTLFEIERADKKIRNADRSRLVNNGLLLVPSEASLPEVNTTTAAGGSDSGATPQAGRKIAKTFQQMLVKAAEVSETDENAMVSVLPIVGAAPGAFLEKVVHIDFSKEATKINIDIRNDGIGRLATGLDVTQERLLGMGANSNHWSAYLLADEDVKIHVNPVLEVFCQALYDAVFVNLLKAEGIDPARYTVWYDASRLTADPDLTDEAKSAWDAHVIKAKALVQHLGLPEDALYRFIDPDTGAADEEGIAEWARDRISEDPNLMPMLAQLVPEFADKTWTNNAATPADPNTPPDQQNNPDQQPPDPGQQEPPTQDNPPTEPTYAARIPDRARAIPERNGHTTNVGAGR